MRGTTLSYMCLTDYLHEPDEYRDSYPSLGELKAGARCWRSCGVVEVELDAAGNEVGHRVLVQPQGGLR